MEKREVPVWDQPDPTKTEDPLSKKKKASAKARAKAAGRPYPNLIDNMAAAKSVKKDEQASVNLSGKLHRIYREKNGDVVVNHAGSKKQNGSYDKINLSETAGVKSVKGGVKSTTNWHKKYPHAKVSKSRKLPVTGMWKHLSGQTTPLRIIGQNPSTKDSFDVVDYKDVKRILPRSSIIFTKPKNVSKAMEYSVGMTQSRFGGSSAVGKAFVEPIEKSAVGLVRSGVGQSQKRVAQATTSNTQEWSASARADMRRRAERAMSPSAGKEIVMRPSRLAAVPKPVDNTRAAATRSGRNPSKEVAVRGKRTPEFVQSTPLRAVKSSQGTFLGMPGMRIPDAASAKKVKPKKQKVKVTTRSYAPEAAAATAVGGTLGYAGYKNINKAVDEFGNQIPPKTNTSTLAMAGGAGAAALGAKKFGDARVAPVKLDAAASQAKRNAALNAKRLSDAKSAATFAGANKTKFRGGTELRRAQNNLRLAQNRADISASQAKSAKKATKIAGLKQRDLRWKGAALLAGGAGLAGMGAAMKEKGL